MKKALLAVAVVLSVSALGAQTKMLPGESKMPEEKVNKYKEAFVLQCGERIFLAKQCGEDDVLNISEFRGNVQIYGKEMRVLPVEKVFIKECGNIEIVYDEYRACRYSQREAKMLSAWTKWITPTKGQNIAIINVTLSKDGKMDSPLAVKPSCTTIEYMDNYKKKGQQKTAPGLGVQDRRGREGAKNFATWHGTTKDTKNKLRSRGVCFS